MCGIVAICESHPDKPVDRPLLERATRQLQHRGPDGEGFFVDGHIGLGHRRLSIIDLEGGGQPIFNEDGSVAVVFNGEIYNYLELRSDLESLGHLFKTHSDTECIAHAYEEFGPACVDRFVGMFAFAVWDRRQRTVFVARDRLGIKPVFYSLRDGRLVLASELKSLLEDPLQPREIDPAALDDYFAYGYVPGDRCILPGVSKLAPGHWLRWRDGRVETQRYWDVNFSEEAAVSEDEWLERIEAALRAAVRLRLRSDVPLGVFLSGGVDSSAIAAIATQELGGPVQTFSVGFRESDYDEMPYARQVAQRYGTDHHEIVVRDCDVDVLAELAWSLDEPFADPSALPTNYVCREARRFVKVVLSGDGGDETFAGYTRYALSRRYQRYDRIPARVRRIAGVMAHACMPRHMWGRGWIERVAASGAARYQAQMSSFNAQERRELLADNFDVSDQSRCFDPYFAGANGRDVVTVLQHIDQKNYLPDDILVKTDRMSMRHGLEVRVPLLDHHLLAAVNAAPVDLKLRDGVGKYIFKKLLRRHLPSDVLDRRKQGFGIPIKHWFRGSQQDYARSVLLDGSSRCQHHLRPEAVRSIIDGHSAGMRDFSRKIWSLLAFEYWCRAFGA